MTTEAPASNQRLVIRSVALPSEHGGWGFLSEPILLGLLVASSFPGLLLATAAVGIFLIHQPLKIALKDRLKSRRPIRTVWAERFAFAYGLVALLPFLALIFTADRAFLLPIALAAPLAGVQLVYDARNQSRRLIPEISGALALAMIAPGMAVLAGWQLAAALPLWGFLALRVIPSILYVRARLALEHGKPISPWPTWVAHAAAVIAMLVLTVAGVTSGVGILAYAVLFIRALIGLSPYRKPRPAKIIGMGELAYGLLTVLLVAAGYTFMRP